jgi:hypothetical protein
MATRKIKKGFREMQEKMNEQHKQQQPGFQNNSQPGTGANKKTAPAGDYIDFEEVK